MKITDVVVGTAFGNGTPTDARFAYYRIPGIVVTSKDTVIAYFEARTNGTDYDGIDIVAYRSTDGGETFGESTILAAGAATGTTMNNPVMIAGENGVVHFLYCVEYGVCDQCHLAATSACPHGAGVFYRKSTDDGKTWSKPVNITDSTEPDLHDVIATGPGHGIRLSNGTLVVPVWMVQKGRGWSLKAHGGASGSVDVCMLYSTDDGATWQLGEPVVYDHTVLVNPNETTIVETFDGRVMLNARLESGECRAIAYSDNGYSGWTALKKAPQLIDPACAAGSARYNAKDDSKDLLLFVNCANTAGRSRLTVRGSRDNGKTWTLQRQLVEYAAGYSDIAVDSKGTIYVLFEFSSGQSCRLARFNYSYLLNG